MTSEVARTATAACDKLLGKKDTFGDACSDIREEILNFAKTAAKLDVSDAAKKKAFDAMLKAMTSTLETTHAIDAFVAALETVRNDARRGAFDTSGDDFPKAFKDALSAAVDAHGEPDVEDEPALKRLRKAGRDVLEGGDEEDEDEDVVLDDTNEATEASLKCPLSTGILVEPMKARPCGHAYSKASAEGYFKGAGVKCAVFGCDKTLKWSDFVADKASEIALRQAKKRTERMQRSQAEDIDHDDE